MSTHPSQPTPPPSHEERAILAAMRARWEAMFRGAVEDEELDRALRYLEMPLSQADGESPRRTDGSHARHRNPRESGSGH